MLHGKKVIAIVPARSGSKGIPLKNLKKLSGISLVGHAGKCLGMLEWVDRKIISTDSIEIAEEGERFGLEAPFIRPPELSTDDAGAVETLTHAVTEAENIYSERYDVILIIEPTSPMRIPNDIFESAEKLISTNSDSVVTVSKLSSKYHPRKVFCINNDLLDYYQEAGKTITSRQQLSDLYWRNGACYALSRKCLLDKKEIITDNTKTIILDREMANIDDPIDLEWARFILNRQ